MGYISITKQETAEFSSPTVRSAEKKTSATADVFSALSGVGMAFWARFDFYFLFSVF